MQDFIDWIDTNLWGSIEISSLELKEFASVCFDFYYKKTLLRINKYHRKHSIVDHHTNINGVEVPSIEKMLGLIDWDYMCAGIASNFHGDLQFDNILLKDQGSFLLLDWRQDFSGVVDFGDLYYDLAKLNGGMKVSYNLIKQNKFSLLRFKKKENE